MTAPARIASKFRSKGSLPDTCVAVLGLGFGFWVMGFGFWVLGFGFWVLGFGVEGLGAGFRVSGFGIRVEGVGFTSSKRVMASDHVSDAKVSAAPSRKFSAPVVLGGYYHSDYRHRSNSSYSNTMTGMRSAALPPGSFLPRSCYAITITHIHLLSQIKWLLFNDCRRLNCPRSTTVTNQPAPIGMR